MSCYKNERTNFLQSCNFVPSPRPFNITINDGDDGMLHMLMEFTTTRAVRTKENRTEIQIALTNQINDLQK